MMHVGHAFLFTEWHRGRVAPYSGTVSAQSMICSRSVPATLWTGLFRRFVFNNCTTARVFEGGNRF